MRVELVSYEKLRLLRCSGGRAVPTQATVIRTAAGLSEYVQLAELSPEARELALRAHEIDSISPSNDRVECEDGWHAEWKWGGSNFEDRPKSSAEWIERIRCGSEKGGNRIKALASKLTLPALAQFRRRREYREDFGDEFDRDRIREGASPWRTTRRESARSLSGGACITVAAPLAINSGTKAEVILHTVSLAMGLAAAIDESGRSCDIVGIVATAGLWRDAKNSNHIVGNLDVIPLRGEGEPFDVNRLAAAAESGVMRHSHFRLAFGLPGGLEGRARLGASINTKLEPDPYYGVAVQVSDSPDELELKTREWIAESMGVSPGSLLVVPQVENEQQAAKQAARLAESIDSVRLESEG